jgi:hypothetical protein
LKLSNFFVLFENFQKLIMMKNISLVFIFFVVCLNNVCLSGPNGCGPMGLTIPILNDDFLSCCNKHDDCYDSCGSSQTLCDNDFSYCMAQSCVLKYKNIQLNICQIKAKIVANAVMNFGKPFYKISQIEHDC